MPGSVILASVGEAGWQRFEWRDVGPLRVAKRLIRPDARK